MFVVLPSCWCCGKHESLLQIQLHNATFFLAFAGKNILNNKLTNLNTTNCTYVWCIKNIYRAMVQQTCFCVSVTPFWGKPRRRVGQKCTKGTSRVSPGCLLRRQPLCALQSWWSDKGAWGVQGTQRLRNIQNSTVGHPPATGQGSPIQFNQASSEKGRPAHIQMFRSTFQKGNWRTTFKWVQYK